MAAAATGIRPSQLRGFLAAFWKVLPHPGYETMFFDTAEDEYRRVTHAHTGTVAHQDRKRGQQA